MKVTLEYRRKDVEVDVRDGATLADLKKAAQDKTKLNIHRQGLREWQQDGRGKVLDGNDRTLESLGVKGGSKLLLKDYGAQVGYRTVFIVEYAGPLFIMLMYYLRPACLYFNSPEISRPYTETAVLAMWCWVAHFVKRELETLFVHKFSRPTMPAFNIIKNSTYYWSFGALCGYFLCHPLYTPPESQTQVHIGLLIFCLCEAGNLACHIYLSTLRAAEGSSKRPIPKGPLFMFVSCPNYFFEIMSWVGFSIMTNLFFSWMFTLVGFVQMWDWAIKKHKGYLKTYGAEYKKLGRKPLVPFLM